MCFGVSSSECICYEAHIVIYTESDKRYPEHWALQLLSKRNECESIIFQALLNDDMVTFYVAGPAYKKPEDANSFSEKWYVGDAKTEEIDELIHFLKNTPVVDFARDRWNCQSWVMDALEGMKKRRVFKWKDGMKAKAQRRVWFMK